MPPPTGKTPSRWKVWWSRISCFEHWPFDVFYFPVKIYYVYLAFKSRSFFFFTAANPGIDFGGMIGERKSEIFDIIPPEYCPKTILIDPSETADGIADKLNRHHISFPVIAKPDIGERGRMVRKLNHADELNAYLQEIRFPFLIQEFVDLPVELGVFYVKIPGEAGRVVSLVKKEFLSVTGDGTSTVAQLLKNNVRARLHVDFESRHLQKLFETIPRAGESIRVEEIGSHCRGTIFLDNNTQIDEALQGVFRRISARIPGFYFGRFDIRCESLDRLKEGRNFKILELNGAGSEPGHVYQPGYPLIKAYKEVCWYFHLLQKISAINHKAGHKYLTFREGWNRLREVKCHNRRK